MTSHFRTAFYLTITTVVLSFNTKTVAQQKGVMNQGELISTNNYHEIQIRNSIDEIEEIVSIKGRNYKFIFDTGAPLALSKEVQATANFTVLHRIPLKDASGNVDTTFIVRVDTFRMGGLLFSNVPAVVIDFKNSPIGCKGISGIAGSNIARFFKVQFNLKEGKVVITDRPDRLPTKSTAPARPVWLDGQSNAFMEVGLAGGLRDTAHFDSGMGAFYDMNNARAEQLARALKTGGTGRVEEGFGTSGQGIMGEGAPERQIQMLTGVRLGPDQVQNCRITTTNTTSRIGRELMNYGVLTIDYPAGAYYFDLFEKNGYSPRAHFGFHPLTEAGRVRAGVVWESSVARKKGLASGCEILGIDGVTFAGKTACQIDEELSAIFKKKKIRVKFLKDGRPVEVKLRKA